MFLIEPRIRRRWFVVFEDPIEPRWFNRFLKKGFGHCYAMARSEEYWLIINPTLELIEFELRSVGSFKTAHEYAGEHAVVVEIDVSLRPNVSSCSIGLMTCVDVVKRIIGLRGMGVYTPYQLYRRLNNGR